MAIACPPAPRVMQAMTISLFSLPSRSVQYRRTAHWRQAPTEPERGVPAEERQVEAQREGDVEHVAALFDLVLAPVDDDGDEPRRGCCAAAAHHVVPLSAGASEPWRRRSQPPLLDVPLEVVAEQPQRALQRLHRARREVAEALVGLHEPDASRPGPRGPRAGRARPRCRSSSAAAHCSPSRHGVHQPHDSWAKNCIMLSDHADGAGLVVEQDQRAGAEAAARPRPWSTKSEGHVESARPGRTPSRRRPG